jgi:hypothetical protein
MPILGLAILFSIVALPLLHFAPRTATVLLGSLLPAVMLSRVFSPVRYYLRLTTFLLGLAANSAWGVVVSIALSLVGKSMNINWVVARSFRLSTAPLCGIRFNVEGEEHLAEARPAVLVGNHQTMLDILCTASPSVPVPRLAKLTIRLTVQSRQTSEQYSRKERVSWRRRNSSGPRFWASS